MGEKDPQMNDLQNLLQDETPVRNIEKARDTDEVTNLINKAGERQGFASTRGGSRALRRHQGRPEAGHLHPRGAQLLASRMNTMDSAPKLCHTDSCGGDHAGCC